MNTFRILCSSALLSAWLLCPSAAHAITGYTFTDLGPVPENPQLNRLVGGGAINNAGEIVFYTDSAGNNRSPQAYTLIGGVFQPLPQLLPDNPYTRAFDLNEAGQIVGAAMIGRDPNNGFQPIFAPVMWQGGAITDLRTLGLDGAVAINEAGHILTGSHLYAGGTSTKIPINNFFGAQLNDSDTVVGWTIGGPFNIPYLWNPVTGTQQLPSLQPNTSASMLDINNNNLIVGESVGSGGFMHAVYFDGALHDLNPLIGGLTSAAAAVNDANHIVGTSDAAHQIWVYKGNQMLFLQDYVPDRPFQSPPKLSVVLGINDLGQIAVAGPDDASGDSRYHIYLFTPVPEPSTLVLAGLGLASVLIVARRRQR